MNNNEWDTCAPRYDVDPDHGLSDPVTREKWNELVTSQLPTTPIRVIAKQIDYYTCSIEDVLNAVAPSSFDVVFGRHILWTVDDLATTLQIWHSLLDDQGYFVFIEGFWSTGAGITSDILEKAVKNEMGAASSIPLNDPLYWGKQIDDERYLILSK